MKIINVKKIKNEIYDVTFDNKRKLQLYEDIIVKYNILNKTIDEKLYNILIDDNELAKIKYETIKFIERKLRSKKEILEFLRNKINDDKINLIINDLEKLNLINDNLFAKAYAKDKYNINKYGKNKIIKNLNDYNIDENIIFEATNFITEEEELNRISKIIDKYIKTNKSQSLIKLKNKIYINLINNGYDNDMIYKLLSDIKIDDKSIKKNYDKLYKKYSLKYDGEELKKIIIHDLLKYGFTYEDIKKVEY